MLLKGKSAIVTGGSQGIGAAISLELAREGADICLTYRKHEAEAKNYAAEIEAMGRKALALQCDISVYTEAEATVRAALESFGRIDILVNNAGMNWDGVCWKMSEEQWDRVIQVNLKGYFNFTRQVAPLFKDQKYGKIINGLTEDDFSILDQRRLVNLKKLYPVIPSTMNNILMHFSQKAEIFYELVDEIVEDINRCVQAFDEF